MATQEQTRAARKNIKKAQTAARSQKTITKLSPDVRRDLGREGAKAARRDGDAGHAYEERSRSQLYERAKELGIEGRSKMGKSELIEALRHH